MTEIVLRPGDEIRLRLEGGASGAVSLPVRGVLSDRAVEITRATEPTVTPRATVRRNGAVIREAGALITDPATGRYPHQMQFRDELLRGLKFAGVCWGADRPWADIEESDYVMLLRKRVDLLLADNRRAVRAADITVSRIITTVRWLRENKHIPRDAAPWPSNWKQQVRSYWKGKTGSHRDPEAFRPRHTLEQAHAILRASGFDPRFELLMWLGMDLRLGQVARARWSDLRLPIDGADYGTLVVHGAGKKNGTTVALTAGQRRILDRALGAGGYLEGQAQRLTAGEITDFLLFPAGYVVGRVARSRGKENAPALKLGEKINHSRSVSGSWIRKNFLVAEQAAGVEHTKGRGAYGLRRVSVDVGADAQLSQYGLQALGGWSDTKIPLTVYADQEQKSGQLEARPVRARIRGEE